MFRDWLITNAERVNARPCFYVDLHVTGRSIDAVVGDLDARPGQRLLDASAPWSLPDMTGDQRHFCAPGHTHRTETRHSSSTRAAGGSR